MTTVRFVRIRVEFNPDTSDYYASKLADQLVEFAGALGMAYIEDEDEMEASEE